MQTANANKIKWNPVILWIEVWSSKGVQKVLNKISQDQNLGFEEKMEALWAILEYPGMWDIWNTSRFLDIFYPLVKRYSKNADNRITLTWKWKMFEKMKEEQEMSWVVISVEWEVRALLESRGEYSYWSARGLWWTWALSIWK